MPGIRERFSRALEETQARLLDPAALETTLDALVEEGVLERADANELRARVHGQLDGSRYVLGHLGAHLAIGVIFAFDMVPLPLGTIARVGWVAGNRVVETLRGRRAEASVHSAPVLLIAAVPWVGYAAYLYPLRRRSRELAFVLANQSWLGRTGQSYERFLAESRPTLRRLGRWLVPRPDSVGQEDATGSEPASSL